MKNKEIIIRRQGNVLWLFLLLPVFFFSSCQHQVDEAYQENFKQYLNKLETDREKYLELTGLFQIDSGVHTFGSHPGADFAVVALNSPDKLGSIQLKEDTLIFQAAAGIEVFNEQDSVVNEAYLALDESGNSMRLHSGNLSWQVITRVGKQYLRFWDKENPAIQAFKGFERYPINPNLVLEGAFRYFKQPRSQTVDSKLGDESTEFIGTLDFEYQNSPYQLLVGKRGFTMVADKTSGQETYGGGRYMYLDLPDHDGNVKVDFNHLYNPPCTFSEFTTCLIPPKENVLPFRVQAGERYPGGTWNSEF